MKSLKLIGATFLSLGLFSISTVQAQSFNYSTDFSGTNFQSDNTLPVVNNPETQGNWYNVSASPDVSYSSFIVGTGGGSNYLSLGGYYSSIVRETPTSAYTYAQQGINVQDNSVGFNSVFQINPGTTTRDSFGWTLFNTAGQQLVSVDLNPAGTTQYTLGVTSFANDSSFSSLSFYNNGQALIPLDGNTSYRLGFNVYNIGSTEARVDAFSYNSGNSFPPTYLGQAIIEGVDWTNVAGTEIGIIGATWALTDYENLGNYGDNFIAMNTLSVNSIPEPQTWVLFGISGLILVVAVRRRATA